MTRVICIVQRLGANVGGGKLNAIFRRLNLLADRPDTQVTLLNLTPGVNQKIAFAILKRKGVFDARVQHQSVHEFCAPADARFVPAPDHLIPDYDDVKIEQGGAKYSYFREGDMVMRDTCKPTDAGELRVRSVRSCGGGELRLKYLSDALCESLFVHDSGDVFKQLYHQGRAAVGMLLREGEVVYALDYASRKRFRFVNNMHKAMVRHGFGEDAVVFLDGVNVAFLSRYLDAKKVLFLHADHRLPNGEIVPRPQFWIENFKGDMIALATKVQKQRLQEDLKIAAPIRVVPHYADVQPMPKGRRKHICTVSRLELEGKPIHQTIEAFARIKDQIGDVDYHIYGSGVGEPELERLIDALGLQDRVKLKGYTADPARVFKRSLLSLAPTLTEGFGLALLESMTYGCPVVSYDVDYGPRELIRPGENGELVAPGDIDQIGQAILRVLGDLDRYAACAHDSAEEYSFDAYRRRYFDMIDELMGQPYRFDIAAVDLKLEIARCLKKAPIAQKGALLDLYIQRCAAQEDHEGVYEGFRQKLDLFPRLQRPLMRCIWLSWRFRRLGECRHYMRLFKRRFPSGYAQFLVKYPEISAMLREEPMAVLLEA